MTSRQPTIGRDAVLFPDVPASGKADAPSKVGHGVIYAAELNIPAEALNEYRLGMEALHKNDFKPAEKHLERATELYPKYSSAFNSLGVAYQRDPERQDAPAPGQTSAILRSSAAKGAFRQALALNPNNAEAATNLGIMLMNEGEPAEAERLLRIAEAIRPDRIEIAVGLMLAELKLRHFEDVLATARRLPRGAEKKFPVIHLARGAALEARSEAKEAAKEYREFLKRTNDASQAGWVQAALQRMEK